MVDDSSEVRSETIIKVTKSSADRLTESCRKILQLDKLTRKQTGEIKTGPIVTFVLFTLLSDLTTAANLACSAGVFWAAESVVLMFVLL